MVMYLKTVNYFKNIKGLLLCDIVDKMSNTNLKSGEKLMIPRKQEEERIYVIAEGEVFIKENEKQLDRLKKGDVYGHVFDLDNVNNGDEIEAFGDAVVFHVSVYDFYNVMANHHELTQGFIKNILKTNSSEKAS